MNVSLYDVFTMVVDLIDTTDSAKTTRRLVELAREESIRLAQELERSEVKQKGDAYDLAAACNAIIDRVSEFCFSGTSDHKLAIWAGDMLSDRGEPVPEWLDLGREREPEKAKPVDTAMTLRAELLECKKRETDLRRDLSLLCRMSLAYLPTKNIPAGSTAAIFRQAAQVYMGRHGLEGTPLDNLKNPCSCCVKSKTAPTRRKKAASKAKVRKTKTVKRKTTKRAGRKAK